MARYYRYNYPFRTYNYPRYKQPSKLMAPNVTADLTDKPLDVQEEKPDTRFKNWPRFLSSIATGNIDTPLLKLFNFPIYLDDIILIALILLLLLDNCNDDIVLILLIFLLVTGKDFIG